MPSRKISTTNGFTILELLIVMGIFTFIASIGLFISMDSYRDYAFRSQASMLVSALQKTRSRSLNNVHGAPHGLEITSSSYTLFQGASYAARTPSYDETYAITNATASGSIGEVVFTQLTGESSVAGTVLVTADGHTATISLNYEGRISW